MATESIFANVTIRDDKVVDRLLSPMIEASASKKQRLARPPVAKQASSQQVHRMLSGKAKWIKSLG